MALNFRTTALLLRYFISACLQQGKIPEMDLASNLIIGHLFIASNASPLSYGKS